MYSDRSARCSELGSAACNRSYGQELAHVVCRRIAVQIAVQSIVLAGTAAIHEHDIAVTVDASVRFRAKRSGEPGGPAARAAGEVKERIGTTVAAGGGSNDNAERQAPPAGSGAVLPNLV